MSLTLGEFYAIVCARLSRELGVTFDMRYDGGQIEFGAKIDSGVVCLIGLGDSFGLPDGWIAGVYSTADLRQREPRKPPRGWAVLDEWHSDDEIIEVVRHALRAA